MLADYMTIESAAEAFAGNWQRFQSFAWDRAYGDDERIPDPERWGVFYTHNRDSGLLDQSNADAIAEMLAPYVDAVPPSVVTEDHNHWAVGWVAGYAVRVYSEDGSITDAFRTLWDIAESLANYPVLDEGDYSEREYNATLENIEQEGGWLARREDIELPDDWAPAVFSWFWEHNQRAVENRDDNGGYPSEDELREAFASLGWLPEDPEDD